MFPIKLIKYSSPRQYLHSDPSGMQTEQKLQTILEINPVPTFPLRTIPHPNSKFSTNLAMALGQVVEVTPQNGNTSQPVSGKFHIPSRNGFFRYVPILKSVAIVLRIFPKRVTKDFLPGRLPPSSTSNLPCEGVCW